jgi:hypothetical protein
MLIDVCGGLTEGLDTVDVREAQALQSHETPLPS